MRFPERKAEADLMYQCIDASNVAFGEINYAAWWQRRKPSTWDMDPNRARAKVEAHGTGTTIGDATEAHALQDPPMQQFIPLREGLISTEGSSVSASCYL